MKKQKRLFGMVLAILMILALLTGCTGQAATPVAEASAPAAETQAETQTAAQESAAEEDTFKPYTFTDMEGHEITISEPVKTVYITDMTPLPAVYCYYKNGAEGLVGIPDDSYAIIKDSVFAEVYPDILEVPQYVSDGENINIESIVAADPDVVFYTGGYEGTYEALTNAGLTAVGFTTAMSADCNAMDNLQQWLEQLDKVFGVESSERSKALIDYNNQVFENISSRSAEIADEDKPKAIIIFALSDNTLMVCGGGHYSDFWLQNSGAINAAAELDKIKEANIEQIMEWDPDIIYLTNFNKALPDDLYNNTFEGFDWSEIKAVKEKQVYKIPMGSYRWYAPSNEAGLMLQWLAVKNQPEVFSDIDIDATITDFFSNFYGVELSADQLDAMLNPVNTDLMQHG